MRFSNSADTQGDQDCPSDEKVFNHGGKRPEGTERSLLRKEPKLGSNFQETYYLFKIERKFLAKNISAGWKEPVPLLCAQGDTF